MRTASRLVVIANRLPVTIETTEGSPRLQTSGGGLVGALIPILQKSGGCWIGWPGTSYDDTQAQLLQHWASTQNYSFRPVFLTDAEKTGFYQGFSNEIIWPLFHGHPSRCRFSSEYWAPYQTATEKFADCVERVLQQGDFVWAHDYHLMMLAQALRTRGVTHHLAYFHHIPFPTPDVFESLPWRAEVLRALLRFNILGFQTTRDRRNFIGCIRRCLSDVRVCRLGENYKIRAEGQCVSVGTYPISIDYEKFAASAAEPGVAEACNAIQQSLSGTRILLGVDRLDYTKGICERLMAFQNLLECHPNLRGRVTMVQIVVPSRENIPEYTQLKVRIERLTGEINGMYSGLGWIPIHYYYRSVSQTELLAFYRAAHIALVTPLKDGMNLVAKEYCASRVDNRGVLVLSEFAGAAEELRDGAVLVNPYDINGVASALYLALQMPESEQRVRMEMMRSYIRVHDVFHWCRSFTSESTWTNYAALLTRESYSDTKPARAGVH